MRFCKLPLIPVLFAVLVMGVAISAGTAKKYDGQTVQSDTKLVDVLAAALPCSETADVEVTHYTLTIVADIGNPVVTSESDGGLFGSTLAVRSSQPDTRDNHCGTTHESDGAAHASTKPIVRLSKWPTVC